MINSFCCLPFLVSFGQKRNCKHQFIRSAQEDLLNLVFINPEFRKSITEATTPEDAVRLAADFGIKITVEDLLSAFQSKMSELSSEELEAVSGGQKQGNTHAHTRCEIDCGQDPPDDK